MRKAFVLLAVLAVAASAEAVTLIGSAGGDIDVVIVHLGVFPAVMGPMDVYDVHLVDANPPIDPNDPGDSIAAVDVDIIPNPADNPLGLSQVWLFGGFVATHDMGTPPGVPGAGNLAPAELLVDTHFNLWGAGADPNLYLPQWNATTTPAAETFAAVGPTGLGGQAGWGTSLLVVSSLTPIVTDLNLAQVAVPVGTTAFLTGQCADGVGEYWDLGPLSQSGILIPEPATVGLLVLGGLGLLSRKRRR